MHHALSCSRAIAIAVLAGALAACHLTITTSDLEGACPVHLAGPALVKVEAKATSGSLSSYCVDSTEVTNAQYQAFYDAHVTIEPPTEEDCSTVTNYLPNKEGWPVPGDEDTPVVNVNWCQAYAYCQWSGKRLCGKIGGGPLPKLYETDSTESQWFNACTHEGMLDFPYGKTFNDQACVGPGVGAKGPVFVAKYTTCQGGFPGLFDMSGNVWEWTDACEGGAGFCRTWGGAFDSVAGEFACAQNRNWMHADGAGDIGFRCCKDL